MNKDEKVTLGELFRRLYGQNGYKGDIPRILDHIEDHTEHFEDHSRRLLIIEVEREAIEKAQKEKDSHPKLKVTSKYAGIITAALYIVYSLGTMAGWFPPPMGS